MSKYTKKDQSDIIENRVKYYIISGILDILMEFKQFDNSSPTFSQVWQSFQKKYRNYDIDWGVGLNIPTRIILFDMVWMDLIILNKNSSEILQTRGEKDFRLSITEDGIRAYKDQRFHIIAANLYEAKETSKLSKIAIRVSIVALLVSVIVGVLSLICTQDVKVVDASSKVKSEISRKMDSLSIKEDIPKTVNHQGSIKIVINKKEQKNCVDSLKHQLNNDK